MRWILWLVVASSLATVCCTCDDEGGSPERAGEPSAVRIGYSRLRISLPIFVAEERGIFERHGIRAELVMYDTAQPLMQALVEGRIDVGGYTALPITFAGMQRSGERLLFVTAMVEDQDHRISYLLRRPPEPGESPTITSIADLRGRNVGILPTVAYRAWLEALLRAHDVPPEEVTIQQVAPLLQPQALTSGGVDALFTNDPAATSAIAAGAAEPVNDFVEVPRTLGEPLLFGSFNAREAWARDHAEPMARLAAALDEAVDTINSHPREANQAMVRYLPDPFRPHVGLYPEARYLRSGELIEEALVREARQYRERGVIAAAPDLHGLVYAAPAP